MRTGSSILVLGGDESCEIAQFRKFGMQSEERAAFCMVNRSKAAKPDVEGDFTQPLPLEDKQFEAAMMAGVPFDEEYDRVVFENAFRLLKDQGVFLYSVGMAPVGTVCKVLQSVFPYVYHTQPLLMDVSATGVKLYNGRYKARYSHCSSLNCVVIAFKDKPMSLRELNKIPGFRYALRYILKPRYLPAHVELNLDAIDEGLGLVPADTKEDERSQDAYERVKTTQALRIFTHQLRFELSAYATSSTDLLAALDQAATKADANLKILAELGFQLGMIANALVFHAEEKLNKEAAYRACRELVGLVNDAQLSGAVEAHLSATDLLIAQRRTEQAALAAQPAWVSSAPPVAAHEEKHTRVVAPALGLLSRSEEKRASATTATPGPTHTHEEKRPHSALSTPASTTELKDLEPFAYFRLPPENKLCHLLQERKEANLMDYGIRAPDHFPLDSYAAYQLRVICYLNAAIYALNQEDHLSKSERQKKVDAIRRLGSEKIQQLREFKTETLGQPVVFSTELDRFYKELSRCSGLGTKELALAESFYIWQKVDRPTRITRFTRMLKDAEEKPRGKLELEQSDTPRPSRLTPGQKSSLVQIHDVQPQWFLDLPVWAQKALLRIVPKEVGDPEDSAGLWRQYERCRPAILRQLPGEANALTHELKMTHRDSKDCVVREVRTRALRQGVPSSFNMKSQQEREASAAENLKQLLDEQLPQAKRRFENFWGIDCHADLISLPALTLGLVTPSVQASRLGSLINRSGANGAEDNDRFVREKELALQRYMEGKPEPACFISHPPQYLLTYRDGSEVQLFNLNVPLNSQLSLPVTPNRDFIAFVRQMHLNLSEQVKNQKAIGESKDTIGERTERLAHIESALNRLTGLPPSMPDRNRNLYLAALYDVVMQLMEGLASGNCKSSKDRRGVELIMADAMLIYLEECQALGLPARIPAYDDQGPERQRFVEIFCQLYASAHQLLLAHDNSLGAAGIKDEHVLDHDMIAKLQSMHKEAAPSAMRGSSTTSSSPAKVDKKDLQGVYAQSRQLADFNKPGSFWRKHGAKICRFATIGCIVLFAVTGIILMATGVFSPLGLIGTAAAAKLAWAATTVGVVTNLAAGAAATAATVKLGCKIRDRVETHREEKNSFAKQIQKARQLKAKKAATTQVVSRSGVSTLGLSHGLGLQPSSEMVPLPGDEPQADSAAPPPESKKTSGDRLDAPRAASFDPPADRGIELLAF